MSDITLLQCLAKRELTPWVPSETIAHGNLNRVEFFTNSKGQRFCLRVVRDDKRHESHAYLMELYNSMQLGAYGGTISFRTVAEQVARTKQLASKGINVPRVLEHGKNWMLMSFVEGTPLKLLLSDCSEERTQFATRSFFNGLCSAHLKGECLWDRWGANELIRNDGETSFIDFDVKVGFPMGVPLSVQYSFDLTVAIRACLQFSKHREVAAASISDFLAERMEENRIYDLARISETLRGHVKFYDRRYCHDMAADAALCTKHRTTNDHELRVLTLIEQNAQTKRPAPISVRLQCASDGLVM